MDELFQILRLCDRIYMPVLEDIVSQAKLSQYEKLVRMLDMQEILDKTRKLKLPMQPLQRENGDVIRQLVWGEMGNSARRIVMEEAP